MQTSNASSPAASRTARERIGLAIAAPDAASAVAAIVDAEVAGIEQVWMTQVTPAPDTLGIYTAAAMKTSKIRMGTAIVPTYPRHPLALAQQVLAFNDLVPERLRLGVGPSHRPIIEGVYGLAMADPLEHLREYVAVLRGLLWDGKVDYQGRFYNVKSTFPRAPHTPLLVSALRENAFQLAGAISDGALSWNCPVHYLLEKALPALRTGAASEGRPVPPLVAHIPVALSQDRQEVIAAARRQLGLYGKLPFYAKMFANAGFPVSPEGELSEALIENLVVSGDEATIEERLKKNLEAGLDELLIMPIPVKNGKDEQFRIMRLLGQI
ncbi:LLM class flavin-dependent oxidoreductase [Ktedonobacter racemifer]|uniref:Luciferase-like monooxygenase n=1 Tax=Ktedonobacter racemifer DSM 44963 TaxID=485913 RepID=D6TXF9_KTERA|nr:LLM class flavin-dependent oxidoreductase [Ktedonobacter racemifer]EFH84892.1 luciferase-like monooxygenase [Ktedonobacter racemifer DSM 44963]